MPKLDQRTAECHVFTYKEGALSALAHDLEIAVGRFTIEITDDQAVDATFDASSLTVLHAIKDGRPHDMGEGDKKKIQRTIADDVLDARRYPEIRFRAAKPSAAGDGFALAGELTLHGKTRPVAVKTQLVNGRQVAKVTLHQLDFGIKPFSAMLGTLKIKPDLEVRVSVPWPVARDT